MVPSCIFHASTRAVSVWPREQRGGIAGAPRPTGLRGSGTIRQARNQIDEHIGVDRLQQMRVETRLFGLSPILFFPPAGQRYEKWLKRSVYPDTFRHLVAIQSREPDIEQNHMRAPLRGDLDGVETVMRLSDFVRL